MIITFLFAVFVVAITITIISPFTTPIRQLLALSIWLYVNTIVHNNARIFSAYDSRHCAQQSLTTYDSDTWADRLCRRVVDIY